jgi:hypothetical protein
LGSVKPFDADGSLDGAFYCGLIFDILSHFSVFYAWDSMFTWEFAVG